MKTFKEGLRDYVFPTWKSNFILTASAVIILQFMLGLPIFHMAVVIGFFTGWTLVYAALTFIWALVCFAVWLRRKQVEGDTIEY